MKTRENKLPKVDTVIIEDDMVNAMSLTGELKPCPFCGNKRIMTAGTKNDRTGNVVYKAWCSTIDFECGAMVSVCIGKEDKSKEARNMVVKQWNRRENPELLKD